MTSLHPSDIRRAAISFALTLMAVSSWGAEPDAPKAPAPSSTLYKNAQAPVEDRVEDVLKQLTLEEKIGMLGGQHSSLPANNRLGIPEFKMSDGPMGVKSWGKAIAYPGGVALAASWNVNLARRVGVAIGRDARSRGVCILLAPGMNLDRAPMGGRNFEYLGEDPIVAGNMASAYIGGVQSQGVAATAKHFVAAEQDLDRRHISSEVDERTLHELYLKPFSIVVRNGVWCVMNSYNPINGIYASQNDWLDNTILKGEFGFRGLLMSDWDSCYDALAMANGGLDLEMPKGDHYNVKTLLPLVRAGKVKESTIDDKVRRQLRLIFSMGWLDRPQEDLSIPKDDSKNTEVALEGAREAITLLKNEGVLLPLDRAKVKKIVIMGWNTDPAVTGGAGSSYVPSFQPVSVALGLHEKAGTGIEIVRVPYQQGQDKVPAEFEDQVKTADAVLVCVGFNDENVFGGNATRYASEGEGANRTYDLPDGQSALIQSAAALNPKIIVTLNAGGSVATRDWVGKAQAVLHLFYLGDQGGTALAEVLFGDVNPSGKLPFSWEKRWEDCAAYGNYPISKEVQNNTYKEGVFLGYRWFDAKGIEPLFPFGYGLSYTTFQYSDAKIDKDVQGNFTVTATVKNTGSRAGAEVVQVYVEPPKAETPRPVRELKAFAKVGLNPGESKTVTLTLLRDDLAYWNPQTKSWTITPGSYTACVGGSSRDLPLKAAFNP